MIKIICVGNIKEKHLKEAIEDYKKRINKFINIQIIEVEESTFEDIEKNLSIESDKIKKHIDSKDFVVVLDKEGKEHDSIDFSKYIEKNLMYKNLIFIIGSSNGVHNMVKEMSNDKLSFSKFTFPHQLFRVLLLEQIYRSFKIINNETYHK